MRDALNDQLTKVYLSTNTLKQNCPGISDYYPIYVQELKVEETLSKDHLILYVQQWLPQSFSVTPPMELALDSKLTVLQLKETLCGLLNNGNFVSQVVSPDQLRVIVPMPHELKDVPNISNLAWHEPKLRPTDKIGGQPWRLRHGDTILFKNQNVKNHATISLVNSDVASRAALFNSQYSQAGVGTFGRSGDAGPGLKIYSPDEQLERERVRTQQEEQMKRERDERDAAVKQALNLR